MGGVNKAWRLLPIILIFSVLSVWMLAASAVSRAGIEREFATAAQLPVEGQGVQVTVESVGSEVSRGGRRALPKSCYVFEYSAGEETFRFTEKRLCAPHWRQGVTAELVYENANPENRYWVRSSVTEEMFDGSVQTHLAGVGMGFVALATSGAAVIVWLVTRRKPAETREF